MSGTTPSTPFTIIPGGILRGRPEILDIRQIDPRARLAVHVAEASRHLPPRWQEALGRFVLSREEAVFGVLNQPPTNASLYEGRGTYYALEDGRFVYVKGVGSYLAFRSEEPPLVPGLAKYPGFGKTERDLLFDEPGFFAHHPRVLGTETLRWGGMEFINATVIFQQIVRLHNIGSLQEAREEGLTIPIGVGHFPELSGLVSEALTILAGREPDEFRRESINWPGNFEGLGTVALEVPGNERLFGGISLDEGSLDLEGRRKAYRQLVEPDNYRAVARTLRTLLEVGFTYSFSSAHSQNIYACPGSLCAQADNSDLVLLGGRKTFDLESWGPGGQVSVEGQQMFLIHQQLLRSFLPPRYLPEADDEIIRLKQAARAEFYEELLGGRIDRKVIDRLIQLEPLYETEIKMAISSILRDWHMGDVWDATAEMQGQLIDMIAGADIKGEFGDRDKDTNRSAFFFHKHTRPLRPVAELFKRYILTDDESALSEVPDLQAYERFRERISRLPVITQEELLEVICRTNGDLQGWMDEPPESNPIPYLWIQNRSGLLDQIAGYMEVDGDAAMRFARNIYPILRSLGIREDILFFYPNTDALEEARRCREVLEYVKPDSYGLSLGVEIQECLIAAAEFYDLNAGSMDGLLTELGNATAKDIFKRCESIGLGLPWYLFQGYFTSLIQTGNPQLLIEKLRPISAYVKAAAEISATRHDGAQAADAAVASLEVIAQTFDHPLLRAWHYWYVGKTLYERRMRDKGKGADYCERGLGELETLRSASRSPADKPPNLEIFQSPDELAGWIASHVRDDETIVELPHVIAGTLATPKREFLATMGRPSDILRNGYPSAVSVVRKGEGRSVIVLLGEAKRAFPQTPDGTSRVFHLTAFDTALDILRWGLYQVPGRLTFFRDESESLSRDWITGMKNQVVFALQLSNRRLNVGSHISSDWLALDFSYSEMGRRLPEELRDRIGSFPRTEMDLLRADPRHLLIAEEAGFLACVEPGTIDVGKTMELNRRRMEQGLLSRDLFEQLGRNIKLMPK